MRISFFSDRSFKFIVGTLVLLFLLTNVQNVYAPPPPPPTSPTYTISAHGSFSYGVDRTSLSAFVYSKGNCAHCHEQHASIGGAEPAPVKPGPDIFCLFALNFYFNTSKKVSPYAQSESVCFYCHVDTVTGTYQNTPFNNFSYSVTFGGYTAPASYSIFEAFNRTSYHNLFDLYSYITGISGTHSNFSNFPSDSNPCSGCHNVHIAKRSCGKPTGSYDDTKSAISKPSDHNNLWGDSTGEKMSNYTASYQAPYWSGSTTYYKPYSTNTITNGSNLPDYVTFCTDCHNSTNTIYSNTLQRNLRTIDWNNEKHGKGNADTSLCGDAPYPSGAISGLNKVLSCLDCHEPHGAPNVVLIRKSVNGGTLTDITTIAQPADCTPPTGDSNKEIAYLCNRCHNDDIEISSSCQADHWYIIHHNNTGCNSDRPYNPSGCGGPGGCHSSGSGSGCSGSWSANNCNCCHYHGSSAAGRRTF